MDQHPRILLGDQYPPGGGLLRYAAVRAAYPNSEVQSVVQDADSPWADKGINAIRVVDRWVDYWSIGSRLPWTLDIPGHQLPDLLSAFKAPRGLAYLSGPGKSQVIRGIKRHPQYGSDVTTGLTSIIARENEWARKVADICGIKPDLSRLEAVSREALDVYDDCSRSVVEMFRDSPPVLLKDLPSSMFWFITENGRRTPCSQEQREGNIPRGCVIVPRGIALPLEYAARGITIAVTSLGYLSRSLEVRDRYLPRQKLKLITVEFNWNPPVDPLHTMLDMFYARKKARGQVPRTISDMDVGAIRRYWCGRPTSASYAALGGSLNPTFEHHLL